MCQRPRLPVRKDGCARTRGRGADLFQVGLLALQLVQHPMQRWADLAYQYVARQRLNVAIELGKPLGGPRSLLVGTFRQAPLFHIADRTIALRPVNDTKWWKADVNGLDSYALTAASHRPARLNGLIITSRRELARRHQSLPRGYPEDCHQRQQGKARDERQRAHPAYVAQLR